MASLNLNYLNCKVNGLLKACLFISILLVVSAPKSHAQADHPYLKAFSAQQANGKIFLRWTTRAGFSCQDIGIELSTDSITWHKKGTYFGICGDTAEKDYQYIVDSPFVNNLNFIRIKLGVFGYSGVLKQRVFKFSESVSVIPHPATRQSRIYFSNNERRIMSINFYNNYGEKIESVSTLENYISLTNLALSGLVFYEILEENSPLFKGNFFHQ